MRSSDLRSYRDLKVWQEGMNIAEACYQITKTFPREELYGMTSQIRRSATLRVGNRESGIGSRKFLGYELVLLSNLFCIKKQGLCPFLKATDCLPTPHCLLPTPRPFGALSAASIPANVAEGYGREYRAEYIQFLRIAQGSLKELETHLLLSVRVKLATNQVIEPLLNRCESLGKMIRSLIRSLQNKT